MRRTLPLLLALLFAVPRPSFAQAAPTPTDTGPQALPGDLVILGGRHAVKAGKVYDPQALFASVKGKMGPKSAAEADWWKGNVRLGGRK